jgi:hypothetical protein
MIVQQHEFSPEDTCSIMKIQCFRAIHVILAQKCNLHKIHSNYLKQVYFNSCACHMAVMHKGLCHLTIALTDNFRESPSVKIVSHVIKLFSWESNSEKFSIVIIRLSRTYKSNSLTTLIHVNPQILICHQFVIIHTCPRKPAMTEERVFKK